MSEKYIFIIIKYPKADTAIEALAALRGLMQEKIVSLKDAVAVTKTEKGEIMLHRTQDDLTAKGFLNGRFDWHHFRGSVWICRLGFERCIRWYSICDARPGNQGQPAE